MNEYIDREEVFKAYEEEQRKSGPWSFKDLINSVPAADVAPVKRGKWKKIIGYDCTRIAECSCCGEFMYVDNYCGNCGAKNETDI